MLDLVFASFNAHKLNELKSVCPTGLRLLSLSDIGYSKTLPLETEATYEGNALIKASFLSQELKLPVLSDDSGFEVDALEKIPGVHSARFLGETATDSERCQEILKRMQTEKNRKARFVAVLCYISNEKSKPEYFRGEVEGSLSEEVRGAAGFGYDPIFIADGFTKTFGEFEQKEKAALSHRFFAFQKFLKILVNN